ncbi:MAG: hypothetical protein ACRD3R_12510 [Terriglobales bacterium]
MDVFSGRPNPRWKLGPPYSEELQRRLHELPSAPVRSDPGTPQLGYRGFRIEVSENATQVDSIGPLTVYGGVVDGPAGQFHDPRRNLERWLLGTAGPSLEPSLHEYILAEMDR